MTHGGLFWFTDLTAADPSYALPIITFSVFLLAIELGSADGMQGQSPKAIKTFKNVMRGVVFIAIPFSTQLSAVSALFAVGATLSAARAEPAAFCSQVAAKV